MLVDFAVNMTCSNSNVENHFEIPACILSSNLQSEENNVLSVYVSDDFVSMKFESHRDF